MGVVVFRRLFDYYILVSINQSSSIIRKGAAAPGAVPARARLRWNATRAYALSPLTSPLSSLSLLSLSPLFSLRSLPSLPSPPLFLPSLLSSFPSLSSLCCLYRIT